MNKRTVTRQELQKLIWAKSMVKLAKDFGISDVGLKKICVKLGIPRPPQGYWARITKGRTVELLPLPKGNYLEQYTIYSSEIDRKPTSYWLGKLKARELLPENKITVPETLINPHKFINKAMVKFRKSKVADSLIYVYGTNTATIYVSMQQSDRALRILNTLIISLEDRGMKVWSKNCKTFIKINGEDLEFGIRENRTRRYLNSKEKAGLKEKNSGYYWEINFLDEPNGNLKFFMKNETFWRDSMRVIYDLKSCALEERCNEVIIALGKMSEAIKIRREQERLKDIERKELHKQWEREAAERRLEDNRFEYFMKWSKLWEKSQHLEKFILHLEAFAKNLPSDHEVHNILTVSKERLLRINPFTNGDVINVSKSKW